MSWKRTSRHRAVEKGASLLRTKSRDNVGTASIVGHFHGLVANVYSLKTINSCWKISIRWLVRVLLGEYRGGHFCLIWSHKTCWWWSQELLATITEGLSQFQWRPWLWAPLLWPWYKVSHLWPWDRTQQIIIDSLPIFCSCFQLRMNQRQLNLHL